MTVEPPISVLTSSIQLMGEHHDWSELPGVHRTSSSHVLLVTVEDQPWALSEGELYQIFSRHQGLERIVIIRKVPYLQFLLQYNNIESTIAAKFSIDGRHIYDNCFQLTVEFSDYFLAPKDRGKQMTHTNFGHVPLCRDLDTEHFMCSMKGNGEEIEPMSILLVSIHNQQYPITVDILHKVFRVHGEVLAVEIVEEHPTLQARVTYYSARDAMVAKNSLDGRNIYDGCCTLEVEPLYARIRQQPFYLQERAHGSYQAELQDAVGTVTTTLTERLVNSLLQVAIVDPSPTDGMGAEFTCGAIDDILLSSSLALNSNTAPFTLLKLRPDAQFHSPSHMFDGTISSNCVRNCQVEFDAQVGRQLGCGVEGYKMGNNHPSDTNAGIIMLGNPDIDPWPRWKNFGWSDTDDFVLLPCQNFMENEEWYSTDHGDYFSALNHGGQLDAQLSHKTRYVFFPDPGNVDSVVAMKIFNPLRGTKNDFFIEVTSQTLSSVDGGTVISPEGWVQLLDIAQVPDAHVTEINSIVKFQIFNTRNLLVNLEPIPALIADTVQIDIIPNPKEGNEIKDYQLEIATGAAIEFFDPAIGVTVPRSRFFPVKTPSALLLVRSSISPLHNGYVFRHIAKVDPAHPFTEFGAECTLVDGLLQRFQFIPRILELDRLTVAVMGILGSVTNPTAVQCVINIHIHVQWAVLCADTESVVCMMALGVRNNDNAFRCDLSAKILSYACLLVDFLEIAGVAISQPDFSFDMEIDLDVVVTFRFAILPLMHSSDRQHKGDSAYGISDSVMDGDEMSTGTQVTGRNLNTQLAEQILEAIDTTRHLQFTHAIFHGISFIHSTTTVSWLCHFLERCTKSQKWSAVAGPFSYLQGDAPAGLLHLPIFCPMYKHMLMRVDNEEFSKLETPLSFQNIRWLIAIWRQALWSLLWANLGTPPHLSTSNAPVVTLGSHPLAFFHVVNIVTCDLLSRLQDWTSRRQLTLRYNFHVVGIDEQFVSHASFGDTNAHDLLQHASFYYAPLSYTSCEADFWIYGAPIRVQCDALENEFLSLLSTISHGWYFVNVQAPIIFCGWSPPVVLWVLGAATESLHSFLEFHLEAKVVFDGGGVDTGMSDDTDDAATVW